MCKNILAMLVAAVVALVTPFAAAERAGRFEANLSLLGNSEETAYGDNDSSLSIDKGIGWGFGFGYNFSEHLNLGFDFSYVRPDYTAIFNTEDNGRVSANHRLDMITGQVNGTYNFIDGPFTPYVQVGLGWTSIDSNVADGPPVTGCWWDPWWGYICRSYYSTYNTSEFSYNFGAGLRYEFNRNTYVEGSYSRTEIDGGNADPSFDMITIQLGVMF